MVPKEIRYEAINDRLVMIWRPDTAVAPHRASADHRTPRRAADANAALAHDIGLRGG